MTKLSLRRAASAAGLLVTASLLSHEAVAAETMIKPPTVDYSADMVNESSGTARTSKVFHSGDKTRTETQAANRSVVMIMDRSKKEAISLDPAKKTYVKMDLSNAGAAKDPADTTDYKTTLQGKETLNGVETSKYLYEGTAGGAKIKGTMWLTKDNIPLRNEGTVVVGEQTISVASHLDNLKVEKQSAALFEVPADYTAGTMPGPYGRP